MKHEPHHSEDFDFVVPRTTEREQISGLVANARLLIVAEIKFYRERFSYSQAIIKRSGLLGALALFFLLAAVVALVLGVLLILASLVGPVIATIVATLGFVTTAALFAVLARAKLRKLSFPEFDAGTEIAKAKEDG
jgi:uncharacterized membrane protein YdjX (TVP38/TMEM64 family)